ARRHSTPRKKAVQLRFEQLEAREVPSVGGTTFVDANGNGMRDSGESPAPDVMVALTSMDSPEQNTTTNSNGGFTFANPPPGYDILTFTAPSGYVINTPLGGMTSVYVGTDDVTVDAGLVLSGSPPVSPPPMSPPPMSPPPMSPPPMSPPP